MALMLSEIIMKQKITLEYKFVDNFLTTPHNIRVSLFYFMVAPICNLLRGARCSNILIPSLSRKKN